MQKELSLLLVGIILFASCSIKKTPKDDIDVKVEQLLSKMSIEEKVGQMTQIDIVKTLTDSNIKNFGAPNYTHYEIDEAKVRELVEKYHVGSFLNGIAVTSKEWYNFSQKLQELNMKYSKNKIPMIYGIDHIHGATYLSTGTIFPHAISLGCSFNPALANEMGKVTVIETAHLGHHWVFNPVLEVAVNKYWPRMHETYGEDPYLVSQMGAAYIKGIQTDEVAPYKVAACAKHYLGYSASTTGWDRTPAEISDQTLQETFVPSFQAAVNAGVKTLMINSGEINGVPVHASYKLLTEILRNQLGFKGVAVTDWEDIISLCKGHKIAADEKEATYIAIMAGVDMSMVPYATSFCDHLVALVREGRIPEARLDLSVRRILRLKYELGLFENAYPKDEDKSAKAENIEKAKNAVRESIVLMKNENNILPIAKNAKILLAGPLSSMKHGLTGGWTYNWQPENDKYLPTEMNTIQSALEAEYGTNNIITADNSNLKSKAIQASVIVLALGEPSAKSEGFNDINNLDLSDDQLELIDIAASTGKPIVVILAEGRPRTFPKQVDKVQSILYAGLSGVYAADIISEIVAGKTNPSGKMSFSYPYIQGHMLNYNHKFSAFSYLHKLSPEMNRWTIAEFGTGLSYTTFEYSAITLSDTIADENKEITATVKVKNTGKMDGKESVLWFICDEVGSVTRPVKQLKSFDKKEIKIGEEIEYTFVINPKKDLSFPNEKGEAILEPGYFKLMVGNQTARIQLK